MKRIPITEATDDQLRIFAETVQGLDISTCRTRADLMGVIGPTWEQDEIPVDDSEAELGASVKPQAQIVLDTGRDDGPTVQFKIIQTEMPGGKHPAAPSVNGRTLVMQRNMRIDAPYAYFLVLQNAIVGSVVQGPDQRGTDGAMRPGDLIPVEVTNYPLSEVVLPPAHEIEAWHQRNGSKELAG